MVTASVMGMIYNCAEGLDWFRFVAGITCFIGAGLGIAATVLLALTLNTFINGGPPGISGYCLIGTPYCRLDFFVGAIVALSGLGAVLSVCFGLTTIMTL